jgi:peptide/nickel transport system substrate-binding protein
MPMPLTRRTTLAALPGLIAMAGTKARAQSGPKRGGTLTVVLQSEPTALVSAFTVLTWSLSVSAKVVEGLLDYDNDLNPLPQLATKWEVAADGLSYHFTLRPGVKWHDGQDFTSADVAFSILLLKRLHPRGRSTFANVTAVETPDPLTAVFRLSKPAPYMIKALVAAETPILPKHIYEQGDPVANPANNAPIGTGPFRFKEWSRGNYALYERNAAYWDAPKPYLDQLIVKFVPDPAARSVLFETGQADLGYRTPVALNDVERLKANPKLRFDPRGNTYSFNVTRLEFNLDNKYFAKPEVRQAIAHLMDRTLICKAAYYGLAVPCASPIAPGLKAFYDPAPSPYPFDVKAAEALLDKAGFPRGPDRTRFHVTLDYNPSGEDQKRTGDIVRALLGRAGIAVDIRAQDMGSFVRRVYSDREFEFTINGASNLFDPTVGVQRLYWSKNFIKGVPFSNCTHYSSPEVDKLLEDAAVENDPAKRVALFKQFQQTVAKDVPDLNLCSPVFLTLSNTRVHNELLTAEGVESNLGSVFVDA